jgi:hypothetical protein
MVGLVAQEGHDTGQGHIWGPSGAASGDAGTTVSLWIVNRNGSGLHKLADDAGRPAWGQVPPPPTPSAYLPMVVR